MNVPGQEEARGHDIRPEDIELPPTEHLTLRWPTDAWAGAPSARFSRSTEVAHDELNGHGDDED